MDDSRDGYPFQNILYLVEGKLPVVLSASKEICGMGLSLSVNMVEPSTPSSSVSVLWSPSEWTSASPMGDAWSMSPLRATANSENGTSPALMA